MRLKDLLHRIAQTNQETHVLPENLESYLETFIPDILLKSDTLMHAFGISPFEMEMLYDEAFAAYQAEQLKEALTHFRWLILLNSFEAKYWMGYAATQQLLEVYEKALQGYAVAALLDCKDPYPHYYAYQCYMMLDNKEEADKALTLAYERGMKKESSYVM